MQLIPSRAGFSDLSSVLAAEVSDLNWGGGERLSPD